MNGLDGLIAVVLLSVQIKTLPRSLSVQLYVQLYNSYFITAGLNETVFPYVFTVGSYVRKKYG